MNADSLRAICDRSASILAATSSAHTAKRKVPVSKCVKVRSVWVDRCRSENLTVRWLVPPSAVDSLIALPGITGEEKLLRYTQPLEPNDASAP
jgi:hypothetical protein